MKQVTHLMVSVACWLAFAPLGVAQEPVGRVIFSVGKVNLLRGEDRLPVTQGMGVQVGDRFETGPAGHMHLLMDDNGFFSLRPEGRMHLQAYRYDPEHAANNQVKVLLEQGVLRTSTGRAGERNKQQYRVNTPIAAIGVRGTDYTLYTSDQLTRLSVRRGGVVMAPFGQDCLASAAGPCEGRAAGELFARDSGGVLETRLGAERALIAYNIKAPDELAPPLPQEGEALDALGELTDSDRPGPDAPERPSDTPNTDTTDDATDDAGADEGGAAEPPTAPDDEPASQEAGDDATGEPSTDSDDRPQADSDDRTADIPYVRDEAYTVIFDDDLSDYETRLKRVDDYISEVPLVQLAVELGELQGGEMLPEDAGLIAQPSVVWGRWSDYSHVMPVSADSNSAATISQLLSQNRRYVGFNGVFALMEDKNVDRTLPGEGQVYFKLNSYEAYVKRGSYLEKGGVSDASLIVDFDEARFATHLKVNADSLASPVTVVGSGDVQSSGVFHNDSHSPTEIDGVITNQASEAGMLFRYRVEPGVDVVGATSWINSLTK